MIVHLKNFLNHFKADACIPTEVTPL